MRNVERIYNFRKWQDDFAGWIGETVMTNKGQDHSFWALTLLLPVFCLLGSVWCLLKLMEYIDLPISLFVGWVISGLEDVNSSPFWLFPCALLVTIIALTYGFPNIIVGIVTTTKRNRERDRRLTTHTPCNNLSRENPMVVHGGGWFVDEDMRARMYERGITRIEKDSVGNIKDVKPHKFVD